MSVFPKEWGDYEPSIDELAVRLDAGDAPNKRLPPFVQRSPHDPSTIPAAPRGAVVLEAFDEQGFIENGGALCINNRWAVTVGHCVTKINEATGKREPFWKDLQLSFGVNDRNIKPVRMSCSEVWTHSNYLAGRTGYSFDGALIRLPEPVPDEFVYQPRAFRDQIADIGEAVRIPNLGSSGTPGTGQAGDGPLYETLFDARMRVARVNEVFVDLDPDPDGVRPGASGWPCFDADGPEAGAALGLVSNVDQTRTKASLTPMKMLMKWAFMTIARRDYAQQMGLLKTATA